MLFISNDLRKWAVESLQSMLKGRMSGAIASLAGVNAIINQWATISLPGLISNPLWQTKNASAAFSWNDIPGASALLWHDCFDDFKCARLQVPMDWQKSLPQSRETVQLALVKLEATVPITDERYGGAVVLNPGGPGGSGIGQVLRGGHASRTILSAGSMDNPATAKHFDIIGFDPRGVNNTTPSLSCFASDIQAAVWKLEKHADGYVGDNESSFDKLWARLRLLAEQCSKLGAAQLIGAHMSSAAVARDIVEIFERHGQWRETETRRLLASSSVNNNDKDAIIARARYDRGKEVIQFYGFSYGSVLGAHLLAMYPQRIGRIALDGIVDAEDYMAGGYTTNLQDTDMSFVGLPEYCFRAGKSHCPLWNKEGPSAILDTIVRLLQKLHDTPIAMPGNQTHASTLVTFHDYEAFVFGGVYNLLDFAPKFFRAMDELGHDDGTTIYDWKMRELSTMSISVSESCLREGPSSAFCRSDNSDSYYGILCSDVADMRGRTKEQYKEYTRLLIAQSSTIGAVWSENLMPCTAWQAQAAWRYDGAFKSQPARPALFIGNSYDPVTPLRNAHKMSSLFAHSAVLQQNSEGHCSYGSVSLCTGKAVRAYFQNGTMPRGSAPGTSAVCDPDILPMSEYASAKKPALPAGETDQQLWNALVTLNRVWP